MSRQVMHALARSPHGVVHAVTIEHDPNAGTDAVRTACGVDADPRTWERLGDRDDAVSRRCSRCTFPAGGKS